jgi:hypothetical protein
MAFGRPYTGKSAGAALFTSPRDNNPGFVDGNKRDYRLAPSSSAGAIGGDLAPAVSNNGLDMDLTPREQYTDRRGVPRTFGPGSAAGAFPRP